jgi:hypothetical protein
MFQTNITWPSASSWEFFTTLDYEWDVIRGRRPYRWTIAVCNYEHLLSRLVALPVFFRRFTLLRAWPLSLP